MAISYKEFKQKKESMAPPLEAYKSTPNERYLPCMNPECKSFGQSHPNCRCWGQKESFFSESRLPEASRSSQPTPITSFGEVPEDRRKTRLSPSRVLRGWAEGGDVGEHYCSHSRAHHKDCEYFVDGGEAGAPPPGAIPVSQFTADAGPNDAPAVAIPVDQFQADQSQAPPGAIPIDQFQPDEGKYSTIGQSAIAGLEGGAEGLLGPIATAIETKGMGVNPQDIVGRAEAHPIIHGGTKAATMLGGVLTGEGIPGLIGDVAEFAAPITEGAGLLATAGSKAIRGAIESGLFQGSDEISNALLRKGDANAPVSAALSNVGAATLLGLGVGGLFGGIGHELSKQIKNFDPIQTLTGIGGAVLGGHIPIPGSAAASGYIAERYITPVVKDFLGGAAAKDAKEYMTSALLKMLSEGDLDALRAGGAQAAGYIKHIGRGAADIAKNVDSVFVPYAQQSFDYYTSDQEREKIKKALDSGDMQKQVMEASYPAASSQQNAFAEGGAVGSEPEKPNAIARFWPEQNVMIAEAKGRVFNHLNSVRPQKSSQGLMFDRHIPDPQKEKRFNKSIDLANKPLSIFKHIKDGTLLPEHVQDFNAMYPGLKQHLDKKLTERMIREQMNEKIPDYKTRQSLSLFLGVPLSGEMTPAGIQAAQMTFKAKAAAEQQAMMPEKKKKGTAALSKTGDNVWTADQAAEKRQIAER